MELKKHFDVFLRFMNQLRIAHGIQKPLSQDFVEMTADELDHKRTGYIVHTSLNYITTFTSTRILRFRQRYIRYGKDKPSLSGW